MTTNIHIFGIGALGSWIALYLAHPDIILHLYDDDTVAENNVTTRTSAFSHQHIGAAKTVVMSEMVWHKNQCVAHAYQGVVTARNFIGIMHNSQNGIFVDCFDNMESRKLFRKLVTIPVLHAGVSAARTGMVAWDRTFPIDKNPEPRGENPVCTNQLGAPILRLTADVATRAIEIFLETNEKRNYLLTESLQVTRL